MQHFRFNFSFLILTALLSYCIISSLFENRYLASKLSYVSIAV